MANERKLPGVETVRDEVEVVVVAASLQGGQMVGVSSTKLQMKLMSLM